MSLHPSLQALNKPIGHNLFTMWRCVIAMAHADGVMHPEESSYLSHVFSKLHLTDEQKRIFAADIKAPQDLMGLFAEINEPVYRAMVYDFARLMAYKDGILSPSEEALLQRLRAELLPEGRLEEIRSEVRESVAMEMQVHDINIDRHRPIFDPSRPTSILSWLIDELFLRLGIDLLR